MAEKSNWKFLAKIIKMQFTIKSPFKVVSCKSADCGLRTLFRGSECAHNSSADIQSIHFMQKYFHKYPGGLALNIYYMSNIYCRYNENVLL